MPESVHPVFLEFSSAFHLMSGLAYMVRLQSRGLQGKLHLHYVPYWKNQTLSPHYVRLAEALNAEFLATSAYRSMQAALSSQRMQHTVLQINEAIQAPFSTRHVVHVDDGSGAYRKSFLSTVRLLLNERRRAHSATSLQQLSFFGKLAIKRLLSTLFKAEHFGLFIKGTSPLKPNPDYVKALQAVIRHSISLRSSEESTSTSAASSIASPIASPIASTMASQDDPCVIFLSQPAVHLGWFSAEAYDQLLQQLAVWAREHLHARLVVKKHPADDHDYAPLESLSFDGIAEELLAVQCPTAVITLNSTAALTASVLYSIPAYAVSSHPQASISPLDASLRELFATYTEPLTFNADGRLVVDH